jgi:FKBP-type peptidyl-prolyl cis-trans isomerase
MIRNHLALLLVAFGMMGCGQSGEESSNKGTAASADTKAVEAVVTDEVEIVCRDADENGHIDIAPGLEAIVLTNGLGRVAEVGDYADVHTTLWLHDASAEGGRGAEIWSSGGVEPFQFKLGSGQVIKGWDMGVPCMLVGETRELIIAGELAYGAAGRGEIPPNAALLFNIELVKLTASTH